MHIFKILLYLKYNSILNLSLPSESGNSGWSHWLAIIFPCEKKDVWELSQCQGLVYSLYSKQGETVLGMKYSGNAGLLCAELEAGCTSILPYVTTIFLVILFINHSVRPDHAGCIPFETDFYVYSIFLWE